MKKVVFFGMIIGSFVGSYIPLLWGSSIFSVTSIFLCAIGGFIGIWVGYKMGGGMG